MYFPLRRLARIKFCKTYTDRSAWLLMPRVEKTGYRLFVTGINTVLMEMIVGVLTTCHTQYTWDSSCTDGSRNSRSFLLWCAVCSSYAFLRLERSSLRWRRTTVRRHFVCLQIMKVGQSQLSSGNSAPKSGKNHHLTIPLEGGMHSFKRQGACVKEIITADMLQSVWNELDYRVDVCRKIQRVHI